jgi:hypothetical protein
MDADRHSKDGRMDGTEERTVKKMERENITGHIMTKPSIIHTITKWNRIHNNDTHRWYGWDH